MIRNFGVNVDAYYVERVRKNFEDRAKRLKKIKTRAAAEKYVAEVRKKIRKIFAFPKRTPLNASVTARHEYNGFSMENVIYFSRPGYPVTANLYLPAKRKGKVPGVLCVCGHSDEGKACTSYQSVCVSLALKGFAVLVIDPVEQGERHQYRDAPENPFGLCGNHNLMGKHLALCGEWFGAWRAWDAVRGLDYMETRPEIDCTKLSVTGNSGGGTLTTWVAAADPRPVAVAPSCYITSWKHNVENELPADIEQMPPHALEYGLEMGDFLLAQAPRNILILGQKYDFFDARGVPETWAQVAHVNGLLGGKTEYFIGPNEHGYHPANREAAYGFLTEVILGKKNSAEPKLELPPEPETYAAEDGDQRNIPGVMPLRKLTGLLGAALAEKRPVLSGEKLRNTLKKLLNIGKPFVPYYRLLCGEGVADNRGRWGLETVPGKVMCMLSHNFGCHHIDRDAKKITLCISSLDAETEYGKLKPAKDEQLYTLDVRGIGDMMPCGTEKPSPQDFFNPYLFDYHYAALGIMFNEPILGGKVFDILCAVELLAEEGAKITLKAEGLGCIPALMAAVLSDKVAHLKLTDMPESYESMLESTTSKYPLSCMVPGILKYMDLPDLLKAVKSKL